MFDDTTTEISRHADGSIDYAYYAARASIARNSKIKHMIREQIGTRAQRSPLLSLMATLVLLAILF